MNPEDDWDQMIKRQMSFKIYVTKRNGISNTRTACSPPDIFKYKLT